MTIKYEVKGTAADDNTWEVTGQLDVLAIHDFFHICNMVGRDVFMRITEGRAVFGQPGTSCRGPYQITKFSWEKVE